MGIMRNISVLILAAVLMAGCNGQELKTEVKAEVQSPARIEKQEQKTEKKEVLRFDFEQYQSGQLPSAWIQAFTGKGSGTDWKIVDDAGNKVMAQLSSDNPNYHFNVVVYDDLETKDVQMKVRLKGVAGRMDRGGGFVWRYTDADNYYVVRANPLEDNVVLYKVVDGRRTDLPIMGKGRTYGVDVDALGNDWNILGLSVKGDLFTVYLNGKELFQVKDSSIKNAGKVGLWTKADAVTYFDDFVVDMNI
jgi:hypothetical protein